MYTHGPENSDHGIYTTNTNLYTKAHMCHIFRFSHTSYMSDVCRFTSNTLKRK